jgi:hypothetical protein
MELEIRKEGKQKRKEEEGRKEGEGEDAEGMVRARACVRKRG